MIASSADPPLLACHQLHKSYGTRTVLRGVSATFEAGDVV